MQWFGKRAFWTEKTANTVSVRQKQVGCVRGAERRPVDLWHNMSVDPGGGEIRKTLAESHMVLLALYQMHIQMKLRDAM